MGSFGERMFMRAGGTDVAGKRLPRQTIPKSVLSDKDKVGVRCRQIILYFLGTVSLGSVLAAEHHRPSIPSVR